MPRAWAAASALAICIDMRDGLAYRQGAAIEPSPQRLALDELAHDEGARVEVAEVVDDEDVRMIERRGGSRLGVEPAQTIGVGGDLRRQQLQRDRTIELRIVRAIDLAHAAGADPRDDAIAADGAADQLVRGAIASRR